MRELSFTHAGETAGPSNAQGAISQEQQQFADALGNSLVEKWLKDQTAADKTLGRTDAESRCARRTDGRHQQVAHDTSSNL